MANNKKRKLLMVSKPNTTPITKNPTSSQISPSQHLIEGAKKLFAKEAHTDLTIICGQREWQVHKFCLCAQSEFFEKALSGHFKEGQEDKIDLSEELPYAIEALIHYFYNWEYYADTDKYDGIPKILVHVAVYALADKYFVPPLKELALHEFKECAMTQWNSPDFANAVEDVYRSTPGNELRSIVVKIVKAHGKELFGRIGEESDLVRVLRQNADFGADMTLALVKGDKCLEPDESALGDPMPFPWSLETRHLQSNVLQTDGNE